jgi:hypothetical protein
MQQEDCFYISLLLISSVFFLSSKACTSSLSSPVDNTLITSTSSSLIQTQSPFDAHSKQNSMLTSSLIATNSNSQPKKSISIHIQGERKKFIGVNKRPDIKADVVRHTHQLDLNFICFPYRRPVSV